MKAKKYLCVFCSSSDALSKEYFEDARKTGILAAQAGYDLVYGGGKVGLMGEVAKAFRSEESKIIGVLPKKLNLKNVANEEDDETVITETMSERKMVMFEKAFGFVALPGGFGTLEEVLEVITLKQLGYLDKPVAFLNTNHFYDPLLQQFEVIYKEHFAKDAYRNTYFVSETPEKIIDYLNNFTHTEYVPKWY